MQIRRPPAAKLLDVALFAGFLAYIWAGIDPRLLYHWQAPAFYVTAGFLADFLKYPGGPIEYLYRFVAQACQWQGWGALVLTAEAAGVAALAGRLFRTDWPLRWVMALPLVYGFNLYYDSTPLALMLLLAMGAALLFDRSEKGRPWLYAILLAATYYMGGMAVAFFAVLAAGALADNRSLAVAAPNRRRFVFAGAAVVVAAALPIAVEKSGLIYLSASARDWFIDADVRKMAVRWLLLVLCAAGTLVFRVPARRKLISALAVFSCLAGVCVFSYRTNARDRRLALVDYYTSQENWPHVVVASQTLVTADFNSLTRYEINLALHEMNRLGDEMFRFPQAGSMLPALRTDSFLPYMIRLTDLFLRLGRINDAEHYGNEAIVLGRSDPRVYRLMAEIHLAKGQTGAARKFLNILSSEAGSTGWAHRSLHGLDQDSGLVSDARIQLLHRRMLHSDDVIPVWQNPDKPDADVNRLLVDQLEQDPTNRMAFEFLMGNYLLARDLPSARALMPRIKNMSGPGYEISGRGRRTPRYYQEAMAMYADGSGQLVQLEGLKIDPETLNTMAVFKRLLSQSGGRDAAFQATWPRFRDSYFFYYVFGPGDYR